MSRKSKEDWLREGGLTLADMGISSLTIDTLASRLHVTKGSFYHHFKNYQDFKTSLLAFWEQESTHRIIQMVEERHQTGSKVDQLIDLVAHMPHPVEKALRAWALQDAEVAQYQQRIDEQRMAYVETLCRDLLQDAARAAIMARILYTTFIGGQQILPPLTRAQYLEIYQEMKHLYGIQT